MAAYSTVRKAIWRACTQSLLEYFPTSEDQNKGIVFSHINGLEGDKPYVAIQILPIVQKGRASTSTLSDPTKNILNIRASYEITAQFSFCGSAAGDMALSFSQRINNNPFSLSALKKENISFLRKSDIRPAPQKRDTKWVDGFNQDVVFSFTINTQQEVDWIEAVVIESDIKASPDDQDPSVIFSVPEGIIYP